MTKIFVTGATGYIGGDALKAIIDAHPDYEITALLRNSDIGAQVAAVYPKVSLVYGDLDSTDLLTKEASKADIVCHFANADHAPSATALTAGLATHSPSDPGFLIHTSGTGILLLPEIRSGIYGEASPKIYDDLDNVAEITSLPDDAPHRLVDKIVLGAGKEFGGRVRTAIVCPPTIYGSGRGPGNRVSHQLPELCRVTLERGHGVQVGKGLTRWGNVHVHDLSNLYLKLVEEAAAGGSSAEWEGKPSGGVLFLREWGACLGGAGGGCGEGGEGDGVDWRGGGEEFDRGGGGSVFGVGERDVGGQQSGEGEEGEGGVGVEGGGGND
ncbi:hypothetical protein LTR82_008120 [Friedmanniomyces endolithicus]|uniref:NAD(P)-binding domain-containing protein n=1 Tax=Friedmanniomyces endolithicus TaxID=329885 RepID=A0AAN6FLW0_9PEZI|nr:hypothetical protein LTR82_008120 [Friedmanniomyces endolithicus]